MRPNLKNKLKLDIVVHEELKFQWQLLFNDYFAPLAPIEHTQDIKSHSFVWAAVSNLAYGAGKCLLAIFRLAQSAFNLLTLLPVTIINGMKGLQLAIIMTSRHLLQAADNCASAMAHSLLAAAYIPLTLIGPLQFAIRWYRARRMSHLDQYNYFHEQFQNVLNSRLGGPIDNLTHEVADFRQSRLENKHGSRLALKIEHISNSDHRRAYYQLIEAKYAVMARYIHYMNWHYQRTSAISRSDIQQANDDVTLANNVYSTFKDSVGWNKSPEYRRFKHEHDRVRNILPEISY